MKASINFLRLFFGSHSARCDELVRVMNRLSKSGYKKTSRFLSRRLQARGLYISPLARISESVSFPHPVAIVIGDGCVVEANVRIYQNVTLGGARMGDWQAGNYPTIGAGTVIFAGAVVVGNISIGKNCIIGANSVVLSDVPDNSVSVGAPARVVSQNIEES